MQVHSMCNTNAPYYIIYSHSTPITPTTIESERISSFGKLNGGNSDLFSDTQSTLSGLDLSGNSFLTSAPCLISMT